MDVEIPDNLINELREAENVAVLTGAGISAESGLATFREAQTGLWAKYDPHQLATPQAFRRNPQLVWEWYAWRRSLAFEAEPNEGHFALAKMAGLVPDLTLITQNVDSLHQRAGSASVVELHGNISRIKCYSCTKIAEDYDEMDNTPPRCTQCNGLLRPDVVWFGESLPQEALSAAFSSARNCDLFFSIGTSGIVQPAASLPVEAIENGATTVEINLERTPISQYMDYLLAGPSGLVLPMLVASVWPESNDLL